MPAKNKNTPSKNGPTSVVTGGAGFLGSHLCDLLLARGHKVIAIDNFVTGSVDNIAHLGGNTRFKFIQQDVTEFIFLDDYVWHFASPASPVDYLELPIQTLKVGSLGTHKALGLAKKRGRGFLLASTSEIYGDPLVHPQREDYWGNVNTIGPRGCYDESKTVCRGAGHGLPPATWHGHQDRAHLQHLRAAHEVARRAGGAGLYRAGAGRQAADGFWQGRPDAQFLLLFGFDRGHLSFDDEPGQRAGQHRQSGGNDDAGICARDHPATGSRSKIVFRPLPQDDPKAAPAGHRPGQALLGWEPQVPLAEGIVKTIEYFRGKSDDRMNFGCGNFTHYA
jgi:dTDP-glucose 4,6-dehydratase